METAAESKNKYGLPSMSLSPGRMLGGSMRGARLASMMSASLRIKPRGVMASFAKSRDEQAGSGSAADDGSRADSPVSIQSSDALATEEQKCPSDVAENWDGLKAQKGDVTQVGTEDDVSTAQEEGCAPNCSDTACDSTPSLEDAIAIEVGLSAQEYLDECFYVTEVSVLDKDKFDAVPEIVKSDFTILGHLGKGSFSDVFEVTYKGAHFPSPELCDLADDKACHKSDDPLAGPPSLPSSPQQRRTSNARRNTHRSLSSSVCGSVIGRPPSIRKPTFALKCLRPQIRSDAEQFTIGAEDLVHETAILASLEHPNIISLHGRASGHLADAFVLNDGYFILMEKLATTLPDRIKLWKKDPSCRGPTPEKLGVVREVADAMSYLHDRRIIFRDLKPDNVGFSNGGAVKLFDFGFAAGLPEPTRQNPNGFMYERCGTPRFMAPEVGLDMGYGLKADVYSLGILLWEACAMTMPFSDIVTPEDFDARVFVRGERPPVAPGWPPLVRKLLERCWSSNPVRRPRMSKAQAALAAACGGRKGGRSAASATKDRLKSGLSRMRSTEV